MILFVRTRKLDFLVQVSLIWFRLKFHSSCHQFRPKFPLHFGGGFLCFENDLFSPLLWYRSRFHFDFEMQFHWLCNCVKCQQKSNWFQLNSLNFFFFLLLFYWRIFGTIFFVSKIQSNCFESISFQLNFPKLCCVSVLASCWKLIFCCLNSINFLQIFFVSVEFLQSLYRFWISRLWKENWALRKSVWFQLNLISIKQNLHFFSLVFLIVSSSLVFVASKLIR